MLLLAIDTSTPRVAVAIGELGRVRGEVALSGRRRHAEQLAPAIAYLCEQTQVELGQLAAVAVGVGPGLFTGLRVGVTTAKIMAQALRIPVVPVPSLDLVAYPLRHSSRLVAVVLDARRREVYSAQYRPVPGGVQRTSEYAVGPADDLVADLAVRGEEVLLAGDGIDRNRDAFATLDRAEEAGAAFDAPSATALVELASGRVEREEFESPYDVRPLYLRASDAELAWEQAR
ncbi:MAG TPA: tRNA (adenosine(37)-N6)-threonylcarbamoyltransferase complex dimerization subunit type 1 TsaB [Acidimicrobiia bacterium]|nr:tRNA (adenosine(37)-N6)-threonylcarbamoyltransferase complex dimerization subunit type 1 TsaB [Acidimicrobiia bacterium]